AQSSTVTVKRNLILNGGTFSNSASSITAQGNWTMASGATFTAGTSTITFSTTTLSNQITSGGKNFKKVVFANTGSWVLVDSMTVSTVTINAGAALDVAGFGMTVSSFTNSGSLTLKGTESLSSAPKNLIGSSVTYNAA